MTRAPTIDVCELAPAVLAAAVLAVDPIGLGGAVVRADAMSAQVWSDLVLALAGPAPLVRRMPLSITLDRLCGGLDLAATLQRARPVLQRGLLTEVDGGWLVLPGAERLEATAAAEVCAALDRGWTELARDGLSQRSATRFAVLALDEGRDEQEAAPAALLERLALHVAPDAAVPAFERADLVAQVARARLILPQVALPPAARRMLCATALAVGEPSLRAARFAGCAARVIAALAGRQRVSPQDAAAAAALVLAPRARHLPQSASDLAGDATPEPRSEDAPRQDAEPSADQGRETRPDRLTPQIAQPQIAQSQPAQSQPARSGPGEEDLITAAVRAAIPDGVFPGGDVCGEASGRGGGRARGRPLRGRAVARGAPAGVRRGGADAARRLALVDTLKAAAPWQGLRGARASGSQSVCNQPPPVCASDGAAGRVQVRPSDFRVRLRRPPQRGAVVFVVDASGSAAVQRLAEAKGAVELLLADCYARRDQVALISFRQSTAEVVLPPTRSLTRVRRRLGDMAAGGGTPLAVAIQASGRLACAARGRGEQPLVVFMTDARANVARSGEQGRAVGAADALAAGRELAGLKLDSVLIDISPRGEAQAGAVAAAMGARYLRLPYVQAEGLAQTVRTARQSSAFGSAPRSAALGRAAVRRAGS